MKITKITAQAKQRDRYSFFVDDKYSFSLSEQAFMDSGLVSGTELSAEQVNEYKQLSVDDKVYGRALRYVAMRPRSTWEIEFYLRRKDVMPEVIEQIVEKLTRIGLLDDRKFAEAFVHDRRLLRSMSTRKLKLELQKKRVPSEVIDQVLSEDETDTDTMLKDVILKKRQQSKYRDDELKLMQYLARQGFGYADIKRSLSDLVDSDEVS